ncbi:MAG: hypothetical protein L0322_17155, partial [Chloroflexi bacterium]|nr:hypothetical protein [Chloroflexota bacterium]
PLGQCPPGKATDFRFAGSSIDNLEWQVAGYLNSGGQAEGLQAALGSFAVSTAGGPHLLSPTVLPADVTGDAIPEIIVDLPLQVIDANSVILVFGCRQGQYERIGRFDADQRVSRPAGQKVRAVADLNQDGLKEIVFSAVDYPGPVGVNFLTVFFIVRWDGQQFRDLVQASLNFPEQIYASGAGILNGDGRLTDMDEDGRQELALVGGLPAYNASAWAYAGPRREHSDTWAWDGQAFTLARSAHTTPPRYRFEAVQDGDLAFLFGDYAQALQFYEQALADEGLRGWSLNQPLGPAAGTPLPPDAGEQQRLAAYTHYRMVLAHLVMGRPANAINTYNALQERFPPGTAGHRYAVLASAFWQTYQAEESLAAGCAQAIAYAAAHSEEILDPLGSSFYGWLNRDYTAEELCPL